MASKIDFTGLNNFRQKLQKYSNFTDYTAKLISAIVDKGVEIAREEYARVADVKIDYEKSPLGGKIIAIGDQIAYLEFGTGKYAYYDGKLPQTGVPITDKWTYYYPSSHKRKVKKPQSKYFGLEGWFYTDEKRGSTFTIGQKAGNQMYRTFKRLREELPSIVAKYKMT
jgi:hypothetical protein